MKRLLTQADLARYLSLMVLGILALLPFHAVFTTWAGANWGHLDAFKIWKELLLVPIGLLTLWLAMRDHHLRDWLRNDILVQLIWLYVFVQVVLGVSALIQGSVNTNALIYALLINTRFLIFFLICIILMVKNNILIKNWQKIIVIPAAIVIVFGILQLWVLPSNFLTHFGYGPKTIPAYQTVDQKPEYMRLQSTLRGPNPLGAYLILIMTLLVAYLYDKKRKGQVQTAILLALTATVLLFTYSRSAWIGAVVSVLLLSYWLLTKQLFRRWVFMGVGLSLTITTGIALAYRHNQLVENTLFHTDQTSTSALSSNASRAGELKAGVQSLWHEPFGRGPGTAGPASFRNGKPARIAENYYIQVGQEVGLIGLVLFIAINGVVAWRLWSLREQLLPRVLLASLVGITLVNMLSHAWADDTLSLIWWGLAGLALALRLSAERRGKLATS